MSLHETSPLPHQELPRSWEHGEGVLFADLTITTPSGRALSFEHEQLTRLGALPVLDELRQMTQKRVANQESPVHPHTTLSAKKAVLFDQRARHRRTMVDKRLAGEQGRLTGELFLRLGLTLVDKDDPSRPPQRFWPAVAQIARRTSLAVPLVALALAVGGKTSAFAQEEDPQWIDFFGRWYDPGVMNFKLTEYGYQEVAYGSWGVDTGRVGNEAVAEGLIPASQAQACSDALARKYAGSDPNQFPFGEDNGRYTWRAEPNGWLYIQLELPVECYQEVEAGAAPVVAPPPPSPAEVQPQPVVEQAPVVEPVLVEVGGTESVQRINKLASAVNTCSMWAIAGLAGLFGTFGGRRWLVRRMNTTPVQEPRSRPVLLTSSTPSTRDGDVPSDSPQQPERSTDHLSSTFSNAAELAVNAVYNSSPLYHTGPPDHRALGYNPMSRAPTATEQGDHIEAVFSSIRLGASKVVRSDDVSPARVFTVQVYTPPGADDSVLDHLINEPEGVEEKIRFALGVPHARVEEGGVGPNVTQVHVVIPGDDGTS